MSGKHNRPPANACHIRSVKDLPDKRDAAVYEVKNSSGEPFRVSLSKRDRQVFEALREKPLYCASPVRVSDSVMRLRREHSLEIETTRFARENGTYGIYQLHSVVRAIQKAAA